MAKFANTIEGKRQQIEALNREIEEQLNKERSGILERILQAMSDYQLTYNDILAYRKALPDGHPAKAVNFNRNPTASAASFQKPATEDADDLFADAPPQGKRNNRAKIVRYRLGDDTWTGQGHHPKWLKEWLAQSKKNKIEQLRVPDERIEPEQKAA